MRVKTGLIAILMVAVVLAGCSDKPQPMEDAPEVGYDEPSAKTFDILPAEEVWVEASDGKRIHNAVYRPDTNTSVPVFINFSPYWGDSAMVDGDAFSQYMINEYVPRGYAVVLSAVRGTGHSEGCFSIGGDRESLDVHEVVDFFANESWSNGNIGAGGKSYDSTSQNGMIAKFPHPALKAVFHVSGITDVYRYNYREGVAYQNGLAFNSRYMGQGIHEYGIPAPIGTGSPGGAGSYEDEDLESLSRLVDDVACADMPEVHAHGAGSAASGMKTDYWIERDWNRYISTSTFNGSVFFVHGFQDWNVKPDHILPFLDILPEDARVKAWLHQDTVNSGHVYPMREDWNATMLAWMDAELKGFKTSIWDGAPYEVEGSDGLWRNATVWPPATQEVQLNGDVLAAPANNETLRYSGQAYVRMTVTPLVEDAVASAVLYDVAPDGSMQWINSAVLRLIYHESLDSPSPVIVGSPMDIQLELYPQDDVLQPGHSWRLVLGASPGKGLVTTAAQLGGVQYDTSSVTVDLPWADAAADLDHQPVETICFAC